MPWWLSRMDEHWEKLPHLVPWQKRKPSDIFNQSVYVGCEPFEDGLFEWAVEYLGGDRLVLATDRMAYMIPPVVQERWYRLDPADNLAIGLAIAIVLAFLSCWRGLSWGAWMARVQR